MGDVMDRKPSERAVELFAANYNCAQSVFASQTVKDGLTEDQRLAVAAAFGGGIAHQGEICGALSGALMALGEKYKAEVAADPTAARETIYAKGEAMIAAFRAAHGSILCRELAGCLFTTEEGRRWFKQRDVRHTVCTKLVAFGADLAAKA
jgi:C_GCAxxG_C_C family probable redox protein